MYQDITKHLFIALSCLSLLGLAGQATAEEQASVETPAATPEPAAAAPAAPSTVAQAPSQAAPQPWPAPQWQRPSMNQGSQMAPRQPMYQGPQMAPGQQMYQGPQMAPGPQMGQGYYGPPPGYYPGYGQRPSPYRGNRSGQWGGSPFGNGWSSDDLPWPSNERYWGSNAKMPWQGWQKDSLPWNKNRNWETMPWNWNINNSPMTGFDTRKNRWNKEKRKRSNKATVTIDE